MKIIYIDFTSGDVYDAKGAPFANQNQLISYLENTEDYEIHYVTDGGTSETPSEWTPYTGFESMSVSSLFAIDNNFISSYEGKNLSAIESGGSVSSISVEVEATERYIPKTGILVLRNASGEEQSFAYVSRSAIEKGYAFTLGAAETADYAFEEGATVSVPESLMILAEGDYDAETNAVNYVDDSRKSEGIFGVHFLTMSDKLMENFEFTNTESLQLTAEHAILSNGETIKRFQFRIYINKPIAFQRSADVPESNAMGIASQSWVLSLLRNKFEFQFSADGTTDWHEIQNHETDQYYRQRISVVGADWSDAMYIPRGPAGEDGADAPKLKTQYSVDGSTLWHDEYAVDDAYMRTSSDNGESWSGAIRILGQQGTAGSSSYTYVAYASDASGSGFSLTPSDTLKYRAEIHSETAIESPDADDFSGAVWVKYIGSDGTSGTSAGFGAPDATAETLAAGSEATAEVTASGEDTEKVFHFSFGIPKGADGKSAYQLWLEQEGNEGKTLDDFFNAYRGADGTGLTVRGAYDPASTYQKTITAMDAVQYNGSLWGYINATAGSGNAPPESAATVSNDYWTLLVAKGENGADGRGIVAVEKTGTSGKVDTYTITYTDETTSTFTVTNGTNGTNGQDGSDGLTPEIDPDTKHWMIGGSDTGVVAEAKLEGGTAEITEVADNIATLSGTNVPVGVRTNSGTYYPIEKGSVVIDITSGQIKLDVTPYLAYDNAASFTGPWTVYYAAGSKGDKGDTALAFRIGTVTTLAAGASATAEAAISDEGLVTLNLGIPQGANGADGQDGSDGEDADATAAIDAHNSDASAHTAIQNKFASYLPLAGGTMTGVINRNGALVQNTVSGGSVSLIASHTGATEKGAALYLWDEANSTYPGYFILRAGHTSGYSDLRGSAPGGLTWRGASLIGECSKTMNGYTKLPNGIIIQWGSTSSTASSVSATFPIAFTAVPIVIPNNPTTGVCVTVAATTTSATFTISSGSINVRYIAIGY